VSVRKLSVAVLGMWLGLSVHGYSQQPGPIMRPLPPPDANRMPMQLPGPGMYQPVTLAQTIARTLKECGQLSRYRVDVTAQGGVVDLRGEVTDENQRAIVVTVARATPGVATVRDWLEVRPEGSVTPVQVIQPLPFTLPMPQPFDKGIGGKGPDRIDGQLPDPQPIFQPMPGPNPTIQPPPMPPYAWPAFAPYNNYSRVAYPNAYPYEQWPFIGPMYPFPRVPLGWRSVSLTWEDGHWWFHRNPTGHDWWRVRYH
jgi:BON domain